LAGLDKVKLLREPEAAALAYGLNRRRPQVVLVFDLGGGTLDTSILDVGDGVVEVKATSGDSHLGR
jgi:molecular chaperone DnaK